MSFSKLKKQLLSRGSTAYPVLCMHSFDDVINIYLQPTDSLWILLFNINDFATCAWKFWRWQTQQENGSEHEEKRSAAWARINDCARDQLLLRKKG